MKSQCEPGSKAIYTADDRTWNYSLIWSLEETCRVCTDYTSEEYSL